MLARRLRRATVPCARRGEQGRHRSRGVRRDRPSTRSVWATPSRSRACTGAAAGDLLDRIVQLLPDAPARARGIEPRSRGSPSSGGRTSASPACSTAGGGGALGRLRGSRHHPRRRRCGGRVARRAGCDSSTPRACAGRRGFVGSSTSASCARPQAIERAHVAHAGDRRGAGLHGRGQEDRERRARCRARADARGEQVGSGRGQGRHLRRPHRHGQAVRVRARDADLGADGTWSAPSSLGAPRPARQMDLEGRDVQGQRGDPAGPARAADPASRRHPALRDPGRAPGRRPSSSSAARTSPIPRTAGTSRTGCGASSISRGFLCGSGTARGSRAAAVVRAEPRQAVSWLLV